jgi:RNA polymerase sigma factor (sigma-70 family)
MGHSIATDGSFRALWSGGTLTCLSDAELMERFLKRSDQSRDLAFEALVRRHGPMVFATCRRVLRRNHDVEDAFQATFLVLFKKMGSVRGINLEPWLRRVAHRVALEAKAVADRRNAREHSGADPSVVEVRERPSSEDLWDAVVEEIHRLPDPLRTVVILCDLEDLAISQAAAQLCCPAGTVASRLARARARLRHRLTRRGLEPPVGAIIPALTWGSASPVASPQLMTFVIRAVADSHGGTTTAGTVSASVIKLVKVASEHMVLKQIRTYAVLLGAIVLAGGLLGNLWSKVVTAQNTPRAQAGKSAQRAAYVDDMSALQGTWLFDSVTEIRISGLGRVWNSVVTVKGDTFTLTGFMGSANTLKGKFSLGASGIPWAINITTQELDLSDTGPDIKMPAGTFRGIYSLKPDRLIVCFTLKGTAPRPSRFDTPGDDIVQLTLMTAPRNFTKLPSEVAVHVRNIEGKPASGAVVATSMTQQTQGQSTYHNDVRVGEDGVAVVKYADLWFNPLIVRDDPSRGMAIVPISPVTLVHGKLDVQLKPECHVAGKVESVRDTKLDVFRYQAGRRAISTIALNGRFELVVPTRQYDVMFYGAEGSRGRVSLTVPEGAREQRLDVARISPGQLQGLKGNSAPALNGILGWKGREIRLADLKGQYVILAFWGYWCAPCVGEMPVLFKLHERYGKDGLAIIGIHFDPNGEVDTPAKLDERIASVRKTRWDGNDIPFPVALVGPAPDKAASSLVERYGVVQFPTNILIDREGKVVGVLALGDVNGAMETVNALLKPGK